MRKTVLLALISAVLTCTVLPRCAMGQSAIVPPAALPDAPTPLTIGERFRLQVRETFGVPAFVLPAAEAGITMATPPRGYPRDWTDGGGAFGRNYGAQFARRAASGAAHFAVAAADGEDPRYYSSRSQNFFARLGHALVFTVADRKMSGGRTLAVSNLAGSAAGGFVGMSYEPDGFDDLTHAYQRSAVEVTSFAAHNVTAEFAPDIAKLLRKAHLPDRVANAMLPVDRK